jgi:DNA repair photolyase
MKIKEIESKTCMTKSKLTDYVINPYTGCEHKCVYCYADFIKRFQKIEEMWGEFVFPKINCPKLLVKEIEKNKSGHILLSSVCDCYQPLEEKYKLTRKILEILSTTKKFKIEILTKSKLVKRDFDVLKKLDAEIGMSVNQLDERVAKIIEPLASSPRERLETLKDAKKYGIRTYGFISPILPGISNLDDIFKEMKNAEVSYVWVELFNMRKSAIDKMMPIYEKHFSKNLEEFLFSMENQKEWHENVKREVKGLEKKYDLKVREVVVHGE